MSGSNVNALLSPEGSVLTDPAQVERALAMMWKPGAEQDVEPATRVCAGNLVVVGSADAWGALSQVLGELSPVHPTRTIVLLIQADAEQVPDAAGVRASVSAICHMPRPGRPQVCCEQIVLRAGPGGLPDMDRTILPLLEPDMPAAMWWTVDPGPRGDLLMRLRPLVDRIVMDAGLPGLARLDPGDPVAVRELGWCRTRRWRELLAGLFDGCEPGVWHHVDSVSLRTNGGVEARIDAAWVLAFLGGQLGWRPAKASSGGVFTLTSSAGPVEAKITDGCDARPGLACVHIEAGHSSFEVGRCGRGPETFRLVTCDERVCGLPRVMQMPDARRSDALAAALADPPADPVFDRTAALARWIISAPGGNAGIEPSL